MPLENKVYILLKDLPNLKTNTVGGTRFIWVPEISLYRAYGADITYPASVVENNPEWFKLKEEKVWTDSDMIEFACEISGIMRGHVKTGLDEFKLMKHQNQKQ